MDTCVAGVAALAKALVRNTGLVILNLRHNPGTAEGAAGRTALMTMIESNGHITDLLVTGDGGSGVVNLVEVREALRREAENADAALDAAADGLDDDFTPPADWEGDFGAERPGGGDRDGDPSAHGEL